MKPGYKMAQIPAPDKKAQWKRGVRVLGISESFEKGDEQSIVVGVVMRGDLVVDGFGMCRPTVGGCDATERIIEMFRRINRDDIRAVLLGGCIISWFNIVDIEHLYDEFHIPIISVTYNPSEGIEEYIQEYFPDDAEIRIALVQKLRNRHQITLENGHQVFLNCIGLHVNKARTLVNQFTRQGKIPEPVRVARICAAGIRRDLAGH